MSNPTPAERRAIDAVSRLGQQHPTGRMPATLTPAEQAVAQAVRDIGSWEYCNDEPDPRMAYREWLARLSRDVVAKVRPHVYREAAAFLSEVPPHGGDLDGGVRAAACDLRVRAAELEGEAAAELERVRAAVRAGHVAEVVIFCDRCGIEHRGDYTGETREIRFAVARRYLAETAEWLIGPSYDLCPECGRLAGGAGR